MVLSRAAGAVVVGFVVVAIGTVVVRIEYAGVGLGGVGEDGSEHTVKAGERVWPASVLEVPAAFVDGSAEAVVAGYAGWRMMRL